MKVPDIKGLVSIARTALEPKKGQPEAAGKPDAVADRLELSGESQTMQKLTAQQPDAQARAADVLRLREAYLRGELDTDSQATAAAMTEEGLFDDLIHGT
jgi:hypothetical protein